MYVANTPFMGYACEWSPFEATKLAVGTAQHFGVVGNGKQHVIQVDTKGILSNKNTNPNMSYQLPCKILASFDTRDGIYDCCWSESNENHLVSACGDGKLRLWDLGSNKNPLRAYIGHNSEVYSVDWNIISKKTFLSGSWDLSIKLWDPLRGICLSTYLGHKAVIYEVKWCPHNDTMFASTSEDKFLYIWDIRKPTNNISNNNNNNNSNNKINNGGPIMGIPAHNHEILTCDFSKYDKNIIATGSCDTSICLWDLRKINKPLTRINGHKYAVRRIRFSPHNPTELMSVSYDMNICFWDYKLGLIDPLINKYSIHTEFVIGCCYNNFHKNMVATCAWDNKVCVWLNNNQNNMVNINQAIQQKMNVFPPNNNNLSQKILTSNNNNIMELKNNGND